MILIKKLKTPHIILYSISIILFSVSLIIDVASVGINFTNILKCLYRISLQGSLYLLLKEVLLMITLGSVFYIIIHYNASVVHELGHGLVCRILRVPYTFELRFSVFMKAFLGRSKETLRTNIDENILVDMMKTRKWSFISLCYIGVLVSVVYCSLLIIIIRNIISPSAMLYTLVTVIQCVIYLEIKENIFSEKSEKKKFKNWSDGVKANKCVKG